MLGTLGLLLKAIIIKAREGQDKKEFNVKNKDLKQEKKEDKEIIYRAFSNFSDFLQIRSKLHFLDFLQIRSNNFN